MQAISPEKFQKYSFFLEHIVRCGIIGKPFDVSRDLVDFEIDARAYRQSTECSNCLRVRNDVDAELVTLNFIDGQTDTINCY